MYGTVNFKAFQSNISGTRTATNTGTGVSCKGFTHALCVLSVGTVTGTSPTLDVKIQDCATVGGTYADITGAAFTQVTATPSTATDVQIGIIQLNGKNEFLRSLGTIGGTSPSFPFSCTIIPFNAEDSANGPLASGTGAGKLNFSV